MEPKKCGKRRSLVRQIGSFLNLHSAPRITLKEETSKLHFGSKYFTASGNGVKNYLISDTSTLASNVSELNGELSSTNILHRLLYLEEEVSNLKHSVERLEIQQKFQRRVHDFECQVDSNNSLKDAVKVRAPPPPPPPPLPPSTSSFLLPNPPPPPPPPPPLPFSFSTSCLPVLTSKDRKQNNSLGRSHMRASLGDVIKDLGKVKLRHIERTESGSPVRHPPSPSGLSGILTAALKRRYAAFHTKTPERKAEETESEDN